MHSDARQAKAAGGLAFTDAFNINGASDGGIHLHGYILWVSHNWLLHEEPMDEYLD